MQKWIERQRKILDFTLSSFLRRKGKNIALFLIYILVVFLPASILFFTHSLKKEAEIILKETPEIIVQRLIAGRHELIPVSYVEKIRPIRGVDQVQTRLWGYYYDPVVGANYTLLVSPAASLPPGNIIIGKGIAQARLAFPGDTLEFRAYDGSLLIYTVKGLFSSESALISSDLVLITENDFRRLFGVLKPLATDLVLKVKNPKELSVIASKISAALPDTRQILREEIQRTYEAVFNWRSGLLMAFLGCVLLAFLILAWDKASGLSSEEKREIGILKAIGWETSDILLLKFWEAMVISLSAFSAGLVLAYLHVFMGSARLLSPVIKGWSVLYPEFKLVPFIDLGQIAALFFLAVVPYLIASIIPSWKAATADPDSVMRDV
jgi:ABC-type lipoprotein release transport system permease subunit